MNKNKRKAVVDYYKIDSAVRAESLRRQNMLNQMYSLQKSAASSSDRYKFVGESIARAAIVRADLNKYSSWASDKSLKQRADLLDHFFSHTIKSLDQYGGVYFRDEGDCIVSLFSPYFSPSLNNGDIKSFCKSIVSNKYGADQLTSKCCVSVGDVAIFQKSHEVGTDDWSAEGHSFVLSARLEQTVDSIPAIYYFHDDFVQYFDNPADYADVGPSGYSVKALWNNEVINLQVPNVGNAGGWSKIMMQEYLGGG